MNKDEMKDELIRRYKYIYENAIYILAPYMYEQTTEERIKANEIYRKKDKNHPFISNDLLIYLKKLPNELLLDLESFLLSDTCFNQSKLYIDLEEKKKNPNFLNQVKTGLYLLEKNNKKYKSFKTKLDSWAVFGLLREFIDEQSSDLKNKEKNNK